MMSGYVRILRTARFILELRKLTKIAGEQSWEQVFEEVHSLLPFFQRLLEFLNGPIRVS